EPDDPGADNDHVVALRHRDNVVVSPEGELRFGANRCLVASYSLQRGLGARRPPLLDAFVAGRDDRGYAERLTAAIARLEGKLRAIERLDATTYRAATAHTRLVCGYEGYELVEVDDPPPDVGAVVDQDG